MSEQQTVVKSDDILLPNSSDSDRDFTTALANSRLAANDTPYTVEETEIISHQTPTKIGTHTELEETSIDGEDIIAAKTLTEQHLEQLPDYFLEGIVPIKPTKHTPEPNVVTSNPATRTDYFVETKTQIVVHIKLVNDCGERQSIYKECETETEAQEFVDRLNEKVILELDKTLKVKNQSEENVPSDIRHKIRKKLESPPQTSLLVNTIVTVFLIAGAGIIDLIPFAICISLMGLIAALYVFRISISVKDESMEEEQKDTFTADVLVEDPVNEEIQPTEVVTRVSAKTHFDGCKATITLPSVDTVLNWRYEVTDQGLFKSEELINFYREIGFEKSEETTFEAFVSLTEFSDTPHLSTDGNIPLYMYPEDPTKT